MKRHFWGIGFACLIAAASIELFGAPLTPDRVLVENFYAHRSDFEEIVSMMEEERQVGRIYDDLVFLDRTTIWRDDPTPGFSTERLDEYRNMFRELGMSNMLFLSRESDEIQFHSASIAVSDLDGYESLIISKNYAYRTTPPSALVNSLDDKDFKNTPPAYKHISGNWYLYFDVGISKPE